ncbi:hypothetical protein DFH08DRAFT_1085163 [Mycena albidolilacea]|uniref:Uncharacterized protein n=1 Tax=Mycena albidolilacea TaxID=1033008 RepID=A0AAD6ZIY5_9AGAR|nr:hypothetical protein DFH08DRAFT_1085163 [Mycena albidolilacea]
MVPHPPMKSKYATDEPTDYEILVHRHLERNEKARLRMARKRAELKSHSPEEQAAAAERERRYQATYRERSVSFKDVHGSPAGLPRADPDPYPSIPHPYRAPSTSVSSSGSDTAGLFGLATIDGHGPWLDRQ